jgi:hypothetical protein
VRKNFKRGAIGPNFAMSYLIHSAGSQAQQGSHFFVPKTMNADYWEKRTALIRDGAVRVLSLFRPEEVDYWRDELKSNRRNTREIELMTWAKHAATLRGRAHYGPMDEVAEYVFQFNRTSEGELLKFGAVAFSKSADWGLARQVIDIFGTKN